MASPAPPATPIRKKRNFKALQLNVAQPPPPPPAAAADEEPVSYSVNDMVMARWVSGDKAFYPARITSVTGSSTAPIYIVKFKTYDETDTVRPKDIRPMSNKRKADAAQPAHATASPATPRRTTRSWPRAATGA